MRTFDRYLGIDYSGAATPETPLGGIRVYEATPALPPEEVPPPGPRRHWTRRGLYEWLASELRGKMATFVGIDHGFSFPVRYFERHGLAPDWDRFLEDFRHHWPTDAPGARVEAVRRGVSGSGTERSGEARWRRMAEVRARAKSVFHFDVPGSVAKSTHAGLPWLFRLRRELGETLHFWPFDGWDPPPRRSVVAEIYPSLWSASYPAGDRDPDRHDAYSAARWMRERDADGELGGYFRPRLDAEEVRDARLEGWILGLG